MKKKLEILLALTGALAIVVTDPAVIYAETDTAQTAAKTIRISTEKDGDDDSNKSNTDEQAGERTEAQEKNQINTEDGNSEKSKAAPVERMDITEMTEIHISDYDGWCDFAKKCTLDTWSVDKYVVLDDDIDFNTKKFTPVPVFAGVFEGNNHTINKAAYVDEQNYIGLFSKTAPTAVIRDLNVIGVMKPAGKPFNIGGIIGENAGMIANCKYDGYVEGYDYIGGIAGYNEATGIISSCSVTGKVTGLHHVGGMCGANAGLVTGCSGKADINTVTKEVETSIADIKVEEIFTSLLNKSREDGNKMSIRSSNNPVDIGGMVGHNTGEISSCVNESDVGYEHVGYNVGGIAGRQSGYVHDCSNRGLVQGRKDVGGIVGQAEPYIRLDLNSDIISQISNAINELHDSVDVTIKDTDASSGVVSARLNVIKNFADRALSDTGYLANSTQDYVNGVVGATNEIVGRIEYVIDESAAEDGPIDDVADAGRHLRDTAEDLEKAVDDLHITKYMDEDDKETYNTAKKNIDSISTLHSNLRKKYYAQEYYRELYMEKNGSYPPAGTPTYNAPPTDAEQAEVKALEDEVRAMPGTSEERIAQIKATATESSRSLADDAYKNSPTGDGHTYGNTYTAELIGYGDTLAALVIDNEDKLIEAEDADGKKTTKDIKKMAEDLKDAGNGMRHIIKEVADKSPVRFPELSDEYRLHTNSLVANIQGMSDNLGFLNSEMKGSTDTVCNDLEGVNDKFASLMLLFTDAMDGALDMDYSQVFEDESNDVCEESVDATICECENIGKVYGDINSGGIAGTMAEEYDFDPEGDLTGVKDAAKKSTYRTKCVLRNDKNRGEVKGKKSYAGGACGLHEIGTILRCSNFAKVSSESADYVGGIAGRSYATIRNSYEKGVLAGQSYIGGITGAGEDISDCVAMPTITEGTNFKGAIAGTADESGRLKGNVFASDSLAGIDRISRSGAAEPVSYNELLARDDVPSDFAKMNVSFIVDGVTVASVDKANGAVVRPDETPMETEIATREKKGAKKDENDADKNKDKVTLYEDEYIDWDCDEEIPVYEDTEIKGEIVRFVTSLASEQVRGNKQSVFLVDGKFKKDDVLQVSQIPSIGHGFEEYTISIPDDGASSHTIRYQMPENDESVTIFTDNGNGYTKVELGTYGKYVTFEGLGDKVNVKIVEKEKKDRTKLYIIIGVLAAIVIVILELINRLIKRRIRRRKEAKAAAEKAKEKKE